MSVCLKAPEKKGNNQRVGGFLGNSNIWALVFSQAFLARGWASGPLGFPRGARASSCRLSCFASLDVAGSSDSTSPVTLPTNLRHRKKLPLDARSGANVGGQPREPLRQPRHSLQLTQVSKAVFAKSASIQSREFRKSKRLRSTGAKIPMVKASRHRADLWFYQDGYKGFLSA